MKFSIPVRILFLVLLALIGWNYWLHSALDMYNTVSGTNSGDLHNVDFFAYYNAGSRFLNNANPYFWGNDDQGNPIISDFLYPPAVLPIFSLLARMPYELAREVWVIAYGLIFAGILAWMVLSFAPEWRDVFLVSALVFILVSFPLMSHLEHGQVDIFIISLMLASFLSYTRKKHLLAAILLAVATLIKVSPVFLLIYFVIFRRDLRFLLMYIGTLVILAAFSLFFVPFGWYVDYVRYVLPEVGKGSSFWLSESITKYLSFSPGIARAAGIAGLILLSAVVWLISRKYTAEERNVTLPLGKGGTVGELVFILNLAGTLIFLGTAWVATYVWLIIPSAWLVVIVLTRRVKLPWAAGIGAGIALVTAKVYGFPILDSLNLWGGIILTICLASGLLSKKFLAPQTLPELETTPGKIKE
jgi:hypothetical protein